MPKNVSKVGYLKNVTIYTTYLLLIWAFYRFLFQLPDNIEELYVKPIIWLVPLFYFVWKEREGLSSLGYTFKNLFPAIYLSIGFGALFLVEAIVTNFAKYGGLIFNANIGSSPIMGALGLSLATAISEETAFRGYIFSRLTLVLRSAVSANIIQAIVWTAIHIPVVFFVWGYSLSQGLIYLAITMVFGIGSAFIFSRTKNIWGSILLHVLWEWPIILFR